MEGHKKPGPTQIIQSCDVLPIKLSPRARELIYCFDQTGEELGIDRAFLKQEQLTHVGVDAYALRLKLLVAGLHFAWRPDPLPRWNETLLQHKGESLRAINDWVQQPHKDRAKVKSVVLLRQIAVQCLLEICAGNLAAAEAHIDGYLTIREFQERQGLGTVDVEKELDDELADRYLFLISTFLSQIKARLASASMVSLSSEPHVPCSEALTHLTRWRGPQHGFTYGKSVAMWLLSHFFAAESHAPYNESRQTIDVQYVLVGVRMMTWALDRAKEGDEDARDPEYVWRVGGPTKVLLGLVRPYLLSSDEESWEEKRKGEVVKARGSAVSAAVSMYFHAVLESGDDGAPVDLKMLRRMVLAVKRDVDNTSFGGEDDAVKDEQRDFWFWEVFVTAVALTKSRKDRGRWTTGAQQSDKANSGVDRLHDDSVRPTPEAVVEFEGLLEWCLTRIRAWGGGYSDWATVHTRLSRIVWPEMSGKDDVESEVWRQAAA